MAGEAEKLLDDLLKWAQRNHFIRNSIAGIIGLTIAGLTGYFVYGLIPRQYTVTVTGGEILFYQHYLATLVRQEAAKIGVNFIIKPTSGSFEALKMVSEGKLDMAFIQGGLDKKYPNVMHAATLQPEALHVLVKPGINSVADLRGKVVNLGSNEGGAMVIAKRILEFTGMIADVDYVSMTRTNEKLVNMHPSRLPDAAVVISCAPSYLADFFVKERGYRLLEIPFPISLALRYGWVAEMKIPDYTYNVNPPVPDHEIKTVGVIMQLVANEKTDPAAVAKVLEALYNPAIAAKIHYQLEESQINSGAFYPISEGTTTYLNRNEPILSMKTWDTVSNAFGLLMTIVSGILVIMKWLSGESDEEVEEGEEGEETEEAEKTASDKKRMKSSFVQRFRRKSLKKWQLETRE